MAADETDPLYDPAKRKRARPGRVPPVIEGEVAAPEPAPAPVTAAPEPASEAAPVPDSAPAPATPQAKGPEKPFDPGPPPGSAPGPGPARGAAPPPPPPPPPAFGRQLLPLAAVGLLGALGLGVGLYGLHEAQQAGGDVEALRAEIAGLRAGSSAPAPDLLGAFDRRIAALEQKAAAPRPAESAPVASPPAAAELRALAERVAAADAAAKAAGESARTALQTANRAAEASARPLPPPVDLQPLDRRLAALESREAPMAVMARRTEAAGLAVVAQSIAQALDQGAPFESALAAAASLGADAGKLAPLQVFAKTGAPTIRSLARLWSDESRAALNAAQPPEADQGWVDRLKAGAARVVRVRPVGEAAGEDPAALGARIEAALGRGAAAEALAAWTRLPEPSRAASRAFGEAARQRIAAGEAAQALASAALADLARSRGAP